MIHKYTSEPWIFDFGIAKDINLKNYNVPTDVGTIPFRPHEYLFFKPGPYTDIFSLGATLLALTGLMTDDDTTWDTVLGRCSYINDLKTVVSRMIAHDHLKRYQNCLDVVDDIKKTQTGNSPLPVIIPPSSLPPRGTPKVGRTKTVEIEKEVLHLEGHESYVYGIVELADGRIISIAYYDGTLKIWDTKTGQCTTTINGAGEGRCLALLSDGTIASGGRNDSIQISDIKDGQIAKCLRVLKGHKNDVNCIIECSDGTQATGSLDNTIKIWDMNTGECI